MKKVCVFTGTRAEYGLLRWVMEAIQKDVALELQIIASGSHFSAMHGWTYREIEKDGFKINRKVEMLLASDTSLAVNKSMALAQMGVAEAISDLEPDILLVLGDRYEALAATLAATLQRVPVGHIHGGEITEGSLDDSFRHAITKLSQIHFVAANKYRQNVIQMGEDPVNVYNVGGLGVEAALRCKLHDKESLKNEMHIEWKNRSMLVTFHPVTNISAEESIAQMHELLKALGNFRDYTIIITRPNADQGHSSLNNAIDAFVASNNNAHAFASLGSQKYLSCMALVDVMVGNSSSAMLEAPVFRKPAVNIGERQKGRIKAENIIDCKPEAPAIKEAIHLAVEKEFTEKLKGMINPFGNGNSAALIIEKIKKYDFTRLNPKQFYQIHGMPGSAS